MSSAPSFDSLPYYCAFGILQKLYTLTYQLKDLIFFFTIFNSELSYPCYSHSSALHVSDAGHIPPVSDVISVCVLLSIECRQEILL